MAQRAAALMFMRSWAHWLAAGFLVAGCSRAPEPAPADFVGQWRSSRLATTPLHLHANGEWEIRSADGAVMQYGVWALRERRILWTFRQEGRTEHDENPIVAFAPGRFQLRERDGSVTTFERLE
jgi:hypothetical protein